MPAMQLTQAEALMAAVVIDALPVAQLAHTDVPLLTVYLPAGHALHAAIPLIEECCPAAQEAQPQRH